MIEEICDRTIKHYGKEIFLENTCCMCPEQYNAFYNGEQVGYLRLRHGYFTVNYPDVNGKEIFGTDVSGDGCFDNHEREYFLNIAVSKIVSEINKNVPK